MESRSNKLTMSAILLLCLVISKVSALRPMFYQLTNALDLNKQLARSMTTFVSDSKNSVLLFSTKEIWNTGLNALESKPREDLGRKLLERSKQVRLTEILTSCGFVETVKGTFTISKENAADACYEKLKSSIIGSNFLEIAEGYIVVVFMEDTIYIPSTLPKASQIAGYNLLYKIESQQAPKTKSNPATEESLQDLPWQNAAELDRSVEEYRKATNKYNLARINTQKLENVVENMKKSFNNLEKLIIALDKKEDASFKKEQAEGTANDAKNIYEFAVIAYIRARETNNRAKNLHETLKRAKKELAMAEEEAVKAEQRFNEAEEELSNLVKSPHEFAELLLLYFLQSKVNEAKNTCNFMYFNVKHKCAIVLTKRAKLKVSETKEQKAGEQKVAEDEFKEAEEVENTIYKQDVRPWQTQNVNIRVAMIIKAKERIKVQGNKVMLMEKKLNVEKENFEKLPKKIEQLKAQIDEVICRDKQVVGTLEGTRLELDISSLPLDKILLEELQKTLTNYDKKLKYIQLELNCEKGILHLVQLQLKIAEIKMESESFTTIEGLIADFRKEIKGFEEICRIRRNMDS